MAPPRRVALVTCRELPDLTPDDRLLPPALRAESIEGVPAVWDDPKVDWRGFDGAVLRSPWDYAQQHERFLAWLDGVADHGLPVWNPPPVVRPNAEKSYLLGLAARGVPTIPTRHLPRGAQATLQGVLDETGWDEAVVKPAVSAGGFRTWRVARGEAATHEAGFASLLAEGAVLVQPLVPEVLTEGEWSLTFLDGAFSHAMRKRPRQGEFRIHEKHGGSTTGAQAPPALVAQAEAALHAWGPADLLYARVDGPVVDGTLWVMELELIEPELFFRFGPGSPARFARALRERLDAAT